MLERKGLIPVSFKVLAIVFKVRVIHSLLDLNLS